MNKKQKLEQLYQKLIADLQDIILLDESGTILSWCPKAEEIKGYKEEEILGQHFGIFYMPQDRQFGLPELLLQTAIREGKAYFIGKRVRRDGTTFWGSIHITALHDEDGAVVGFAKLTKLITPDQAS